MDKALGLIETVGLPAAIEAADAAVKSAQVTLLGCESAKGGGLTVVMITGDVGAVKAAVEAGKTAASKVGRVWSTHVIPRPHSNTGDMLKPGCIGGKGAKKRKPAGEGPPILLDNGQQLEVIEEKIQEAENNLNDHQERASEVSLNKELCNLCQDSLCNRKKGEPKVNCLHYGDKEAEI